jgi:hypothetical protein
VQEGSFGKKSPTLIHPPPPLSVVGVSNSNFAAQRKKNDALALKTILSGLSSPIKESMGQCTSAKDLWLKLEETYQSK